MKKIVFVFVIFIILIFSSCNSIDNDDSGNANNSFHNTSNHEEEYDTKKDTYFPKEIGINDFINNWYSRHLAALEEPVIPEQTDDYISIYRFTCLRSFHNPFSIRIEINEQNESAILFFKMCDGAGGYDPGELIISEQKTFEPDEINSFIETIEKYDYWKMPFDEEDSGGCDGSEWIIELLKDGKYHAISRWSPEYKEQHQLIDGQWEIYSLDRISDLDAIYELGLFFIELSQQEIEELY